MVRPHKRSVARAEEKFGLDELAEKRIAYRTVQSPQPLCLSGRQAQTRHFDVLALHTSKHIEWLLLYCHGLTPLGCGNNRPRIQSNGCATTAVNIEQQAELADRAKNRLIGP